MKELKKMCKCKNLLLFLVLIIFIGIQNCSSVNTELEKNCKDYTQFVNPFIGTGGSGNTFPGAVVPFGMLQLSPDTEVQIRTNGSGYKYEDEYLYGFSLTHLSGTGVADMGDFLFVPSVGEVQLQPGTKANPDSGYITHFSHKDEKASPGYYQVKLPEHDINVELTASERSGMMKYTFPKSEDANILIDLNHANYSEVIWANVKFENDSVITGYHQVNGWARERHIYFAAKFSKPFKSYDIYNNSSRVQNVAGKYKSSYKASGKDIKLYVKYDTRENEVIKVKVGISAVSTAAAMNNLDQEIPHWDFDKLVTNAKKKWNNELCKIDVEATENDDLITFYTALYHSFLAPTIYEDVDGSYVGFDQKIHQSEDFTNYSLFALWDTHHSIHPLFNLVQRERNLDMIKSMLNHYIENKDRMLPIFPIYGNETFTMNGYHAVSVIADAYNKGIRNFNIDLAYSAMKTTATNPNYDGICDYKKLGYVPFDQTVGAVSKTLEYAYDDYAIAQLASKLEHKPGEKYKEDYQYFIKRSYNYKNLFSPSLQFMLGKDSRGNWRSPFGADVYLVSGDFTQGTSRFYSFYVPQDIKGLIQLHGSNNKFEERLDSLFHINPKTTDTYDRVGYVGQYWHGNEAIQHTPYLYNYINKPWKTQKVINTIVNNFYGNGPDSIVSHDDSGQLSAWYIFSTLGFYPLCPPDNNYIIGAPKFPKATIHLSTGSDFVVEAKNLSKTNIYISQVLINDTEWTKTYIPYDLIAKGGKITFIMSEKPGEKFGRSEEDIAPSLTTDELATSPFISEGEQYFLRSTTATLMSYDDKNIIRYTIDGSEPDDNSPIYTHPINISESLVLKARSYQDNKLPSTIMTAYFTKATLTKSMVPVTILPKLEYEYFEGEFNHTDELKQVTKRGYSKQINLEHQQREENFGFIFKGYIKIPADGIYIFHLTSDDGSKVYIDNKLLIDHDGLHDALEKPGKIALEKGYHPIMVKYFENTVYQMLKLEWSSETMQRQEIEAKYLYH